MSFDTVVSLALFAGAMFLMMRFGCGTHVMGHAHGHSASGSDNEPRNSGRPANAALSTQVSGTPAAGAVSQIGTDSGEQASRNTHRHGCC
jgi:hypothetical protein